LRIKLVLLPHLLGRKTAPPSVGEFRALRLADHEDNPQEMDDHHPAEEAEDGRRRFQLREN